MCNIALHWTAHITTVQCNNLFIHSDLVSLAVCMLTVATCMHPYTAKFPLLHIIFCMYFQSKMVKFWRQITFHDIFRRVGRNPSFFCFYHPLFFSDKSCFFASQNLFFWEGTFLTLFFSNKSCFSASKSFFLSNQLFLWLMCKQNPFFQILR